MKILVTGGAGFIGSHICDHLMSLGHRVVAADRLSLGRQSNIAHLEGDPRFRFIELDVAQFDPLDTLFAAETFDCIFHLAANSDIARSRLDPSIDFHDTFDTTRTLLEAMRRHEVGSIVFASSSAVYGEASGRLREDHGPLLPISHYGAAKLASESFISSFGENYGIRSWCARFPNVVGERLTHGVVYDFVMKLRRTPGHLLVLGDGSQVKPYLHVQDLAQAVLTAWQGFGERANVFNVGGQTRATVRRIAKIVVEESGSDAIIEYGGGDRGWIGDVPSVAYNTDKIEALGWAPTMDSEAAIRVAARWMFGNLS